MMMRRRKFFPTMLHRLGFLRNPLQQKRNEKRSLEAAVSGLRPTQWLFPMDSSTPARTCLDVCLEPESCSRAEAQIAGSHWVRSTAMQQHSSPSQVLLTAAAAAAA